MTSSQLSTDVGTKIKILSIGDSAYQNLVGQRGVITKSHKQATGEIEVTVRLEKGTECFLFTGEDKWISTTKSIIQILNKK
jgi:hypothetical protein